MEFNGLTSASHMSLPEAGYGSEEGQLGSEISGAVSGVTTPGASRLQASQLQERSATMQRLQVGGLVAVVAVLIAWPGLVLCWCAAPLLVGRAVLACPGLGSWCCSRLDARLALLVCCGICRRTASVVGCWLSVVFAWLGPVLCWCMPPPLLGRALFVPGPPHGGACCVGVLPPHGGACRVGLWPPSWWGMLCWCVAPLLVGPAVLVPARRGDCGWLGLSSSVGCVAVAVVLFAWPGLVLCWCLAPSCWGVPCFCVPPPLLGRVVSASWGFGSWCCSRLNA